MISTRRSTSLHLITAPKVQVCISLRETRGHGLSHINIPASHYHVSVLALIYVPYFHWTYVEQRHKEYLKYKCQLCCSRISETHYSTGRIRGLRSKEFQLPQGAPTRTRSSLRFPPHKVLLENKKSTSLRRINNSAGLSDVLQFVSVVCFKSTIERTGASVRPKFAATCQNSFWVKWGDIFQAELRAMSQRSANKHANQPSDPQLNVRPVAWFPRGEGGGETQQEFGWGGSADSAKPWPCSRHKRCKFCYPV